jgi:hypothetical protein
VDLDRQRSGHCYTSRGVAQPGSASGLGPEGRRFESCLPDHFLEVTYFCDFHIRIEAIFILFVRSVLYDFVMAIELQFWTQSL